MTRTERSTAIGRALRPYVALAVLAGSVTAIASRFVFPDGTLDLDEVSYQAQANALRAHHLTLARSTFDPFFRPFLTGVRGDRVVFKYQPVWPALVAASDAVFHSTLPLRMLMSAAGVLAVTWFARELVRDRRVAIIAGCLALASPFTWVQSASLLGYQLSLVLGTAAGAALLRSLRTKSRGAAIGAGALLGLAVLHRPFDALLAAAPVLIYAVWRAARAHGLARLAGFVGLGGAPFAILFLVYNRAVMGSALRLPFGVTGNVDRFGFGWRASFTVPHSSHDGQIHYTVGLAVATLGRELAAFPRFLVAAPIVLVLAGAVVWLRRRDARVWLLVAMVGAPLVGYLFWWGTANEFQFHLEHALGPFYHYLLLPPLCVAAAWGASVWRPSRRVWFGSRRRRGGVDRGVLGRRVARRVRHGSRPDRRCREHRRARPPSDARSADVPGRSVSALCERRAVARCIARRGRHSRPPARGDRPVPRPRAVRLTQHPSRR